MGYLRTLAAKQEQEEKHEAVEAKYSVIKEAFLRAEEENKNLLEDLRAAQREAKHQDQVSQEEVEGLMKAIDALNKEKAGLLESIRDLTSQLDGQGRTPLADRVSKSPSRPSGTHSRSKEPLQPLVRQSSIQKHPTTIDVYVDMSGQHARPDSDKENLSAANNRSQSSLSSKQQVPASGKMKKLLGAWNVVSELEESFSRLSREFEKLHSQMMKDKGRMEQLCAKKPELTPYLRELSRILSTTLSPEQLNKSEHELTETESEYIHKAIVFFEKLGEEFGYLFGNFADKLKARKSEYVKWNKRLAEFCRELYPQFGSQG